MLEICLDNGVSQQRLLKRRIYQGKQDRRSNLTIFGHLLKYATMASRLLDTDVTKAIRYNFPIRVQRAILGTQLRTTGEALDLLKRAELGQQIMPLHRTRMLVDQELHGIIRTETESNIY